MAKSRDKQRTTYGLATDDQRTTNGHPERDKMSDLIKQETKTIVTHVISCENCGTRIQEPTEADALHVANETGRILTMANGRRVFLCIDCLDSPAAGHYKSQETTKPTKPPRPNAAELAIIAGYLETIQDGGTVSAVTLDRLRALGYIVGDPPAVTVEAKSIIETYRQKRAGQ